MQRHKATRTSRSAPESPRCVGPLVARRKRVTTTAPIAATQNLVQHERDYRNEINSVVILHLVACEMVWIASVYVATWPMSCKRQALNALKLKVVHAIPGSEQLNILLPMIALKFKTPLGNTAVPITAASPVASAAAPAAPVTAVPITAANAVAVAAAAAAAAAPTARLGTVAPAPTATVTAAVALVVPSRASWP
jgi:hypothetical protein